MRFDLAPRTSQNSHNAERFNPELNLQTSPSKEWEIDVRGLVSSRKWLVHYGLKRNKLDLNTILSRIGFRHVDG